MKKVVYVMNNGSHYGPFKYSSEQVAELWKLPKQGGFLQIDCNPEQVTLQIAHISAIHVEPLNVGI